MVLAHDVQEKQKTQDIQISQDVTFDTMLLSARTLAGLKKSGFVRPSPIQLHGIPLGKCGFDLLLEAKSGTGKTAVFTVIALEKLDLYKGLQAVMLAPTREIAAQVCDVLKQIGSQYKGLCVEVVMGGLPVEEDIVKFNGNKVHIVVGSPGRLKHLITDNYIDVSAVRLLVLDEADKLLEKSFKKDVKFIHSALPREKQVIMSSATFPDSCKEFLQEFVHEAQHVCPNSDCVLLGIDQKVTYVKYNSNPVVQTTNRFKEFLKIIKRKQFKQCLIFCNYRARIGEVYKMLIKEKWPAEQLYGAQDQIDRLDALKTLQEYKCRILITTDLAARGIDASNVDLVVNFEPPIDWQTYLHRMGRAGRFGSYGTVITILSEGAEKKKFMNLLSTVKSIKLTPLWPEAENNNEEQMEVYEQNGVQMNGSNGQESMALWKIICDNDKSSDRGNIENFHDLYDSFNNTTNNITCEIESFSDLFTSCQTNQLQDTNGYEYKCLKLPEVSAKQYLECIKSGEVIAHETNDTPCNGDRSQNEACDKYTKQTKRNVENYLKINNQDSFAKSKNNSFSNQGSYYSKSLVNDLENIKASKSNVSRSIKNTNFSTKSKPNYIRKQSSTSSSDDDSDSESEISDYRYRTQSELVNKAKNRSFAANAPKNPSSLPNNNHLYHTDKHLPSNSYIDWYKQLKARVRQIELTVYLDELSKLY